MALPTPRIGNYDYPNHFFHWEWIKPFTIPQPEVKPYIQDGVPDLGFLILPRRTRDEGILETETHSTTKEGAWAWILAYRKLVGTPQVVVDEYGAIWRGVMIAPFAHRIVPVLTPAQYYSANIIWKMYPVDPVP